MPGAPGFSAQPNGSPGGSPTNGSVGLNVYVPNVLWGFYLSGHMRTSGATVFRTLDTGQTWQSAPVASSSSSGGTLFGNALLDFSAVDDQTAWVLVRDYQAPYATTLQRTTTGPAGFAPLSAALPTDLFGIHFFNGTTGLALARPSNGSTTLRMYRSTDGGLTWVPVTATLPLTGTGPYGHLTALGPQVWVIGHNGDVFYTADAGLTWRTSTTGLGSALSQVVFRDPSHGLAYESGTGQRVAHTTDGGRTWAMRATPSPAQNFIIAAQPGSMTYVGSATVVGGIGYTGLVATSFDDGASWQTRFTDNLRYASLAIGPEGQLWASMDLNPLLTVPQHLLLRYIGTPLTARPAQGKGQPQSAYPNPSTGVLHVSLAPGAVVRLYDSAGRQRVCRVAQGNVDLSTEPAGLYVITVTEAHGGVHSQRVVVEH